MSSDVETLKQALLDTSTQLSELVSDYEALDLEMESTKKQLQAIQDACSMTVLPLLHTLFRSVDRQVGLGHHDPQTLKDMSTCFALCDKAARLLQSVNLGTAAEYFSVKAIANDKLNNEDGTSKLMKYYEESDMFFHEKELKEKHRLREEQLLGEIEELSSALLEVQSKNDTRIVVDGEEIDESIVRSLLQQVVDSETQVATMQKQIQDIESESATKLKSMREEYEAKLRDLEGSIETGREEREEAATTASALKVEVEAHAQRLSEQSAKHEREISELQAKIDALVQEREDALSVQERRFEEEQGELLSRLRREKEEAVSEAMETTKKEVLSDMSERETRLLAEKEKIEAEYEEYRTFSDERYESLVAQMDATAATCESMRNSLLAAHEIQEKQAHQIVLLQQQALQRSAMFSPSKGSRLVLSQQQNTLTPTK